MIAYLFIDIDDFGDINKKFGFAYGNKVLKRFKSHIRHHLVKKALFFILVQIVFWFRLKVHTTMMI